MPATYSEGSVITFGRYPQDGEVPSPIEWMVLEVRGGHALLLSLYGLDCRRYHDALAPVSWATSDLRRWLNRVFLEKAFSTMEQESMASVRVAAEKNPDYRADPGHDTLDKVYLLSVGEAQRFLPSKKRRRCFPTAYALEQGVHRRPNGASRWWLRTPGYDACFAADITHTGSIFFSSVRECGGAVRPVVSVML